MRERGVDTGSRAAEWVLCCAHVSAHADLPMAYGRNVYQKAKREGICVLGFSSSQLPTRGLTPPGLDIFSPHRALSRADQIISATVPRLRQTIVKRVETYSISRLERCSREVFHTVPPRLRSRLRLSDCGARSKGGESLECPPLLHERVCARQLR